MSTETDVKTRSYYEGPNLSELGSYSQLVKKGVEFLGSLNGAARLSYKVYETQEPWGFGSFNNVFIAGENGLSTHLRREDDKTFEGVLYGAGGSQELRLQFFSSLGLDISSFTRVALLDKTLNLVSIRFAYIG